MISIDSLPATAEFRRCFEAAANHIEARYFKTAKDKNYARWIKFMPGPPFLEHLSFRLGNQLFFVRIVDIEQNLKLPGSMEGLALVAEEFRGYPCILSMQNENGEWKPTFKDGSGFTDPVTNARIEPEKLVTNEQIEMTDWEVHDYAVQVVRDKMREAGGKISSWQGYREIEPAIRFVSENGPEWVVVRAVRYPVREALPPANFLDIYKMCMPISPNGHFASVAVASGKDSFEKATRTPTPLYRGEPLLVKYQLKSAVQVEQEHFLSTR